MLLKKMTHLAGAFLVVLYFASLSFAAEAITCWFDPSWITKSSQAKKITDTLSQASGLTIRPRIANSFPRFLKPSIATIQIWSMSVHLFRRSFIPDISVLNSCKA